MSGWFGLPLALALAAALTFLTLPVVAIFAQQPPGDLVSALGEEERSARCGSRSARRPRRCC